MGGKDSAMTDWTTIAKTLGYASDAAMWQDLYVTQRLSIDTLSTRLGVGRNTIRQTLKKHNVVIRGRGGANNNALDLTDEVIEEVRKNGVLAVAKRLEINYTTLYKRLRARGIAVADLKKVEGENA
jgi:transcriptional regulator of acetoin/glycerol metabolism